MTHESLLKFNKKNVRMTLVNGVVREGTLNYEGSMNWSLRRIGRMDLYYMSNDILNCRLRVMGHQIEVFEGEQLKEYSTE